MMLNRSLLKGENFHEMSNFSYFQNELEFCMCIPHVKEIFYNDCSPFPNLIFSKQICVPKLKLIICGRHPMAFFSISTAF